MSQSFLKEPVSVRTKGIRVIGATWGLEKLFGEVLPVRASMKISSHVIKRDWSPVWANMGLKNRKKQLALSMERDSQWRPAWILCCAACSEVSLGKEGQFTEDTKLFNTFNTKAGFKGVHENHMILKGIKVMYRLGRENNLNFWRLLKNNKIQILVLCFSFTS